MQRTHLEDAAVFTVGLVLALLMTGCLGDQGECLAAMPLLCANEEEQSGRACAEGEAECREESVMVCGEIQVHYCRPVIECPAIEQTCPFDRDPCDPADTFTECEEVVVGEGPCAQTVLCGPQILCEAAPTCLPGEDESGGPCGDDEADCREETVCLNTIYCRPAPVCPNMAAACPDGQNPCNPETDGPDCEELTIGDGPCSQTLYCAHIHECDGMPACGPNEAESSEVCADDDTACREVTVCGSTIYCREAAES